MFYYDYLNSCQGFPNSGEGWRVGNFTGGWLFYRMKENWGGVILTIQTFFEAKNSFLWYWTSIKIKINLTCVSKEYEIKTKFEQEQWLQLKLLFLLGYDLKIVVNWEGKLTFGARGGGGAKIWWGGVYLGKGIFLGGGGWPNFRLVEGDSQPIGKTLHVGLLQSKSKMI